MPTKPLERLMFVQGGLCFFCKAPLSKSEASVEHLFASANGGSNNDENCVACCKTVNSLLGSMSLKEKFQVVLNQSGKFKCPNGGGSTKTAPPSKIVSSAKAAPKVAPKESTIVKSKDDKLVFVISNLKQRGNARPRTLKTLSSSVASLFPGVPNEELELLLQQLQSAGKVLVNENKVTYAL